MRRASDVLGGAVDRPELLRLARAQAALRKWSEAVGPTLASKSVPDNYDHGTVWVAASGAAWANEIRLNQGTILARLNEIAGEAGLFVQLRVGNRKPNPKWGLAWDPDQPEI